MPFYLDRSCLSQNRIYFPNLGFIKANNLPENFAQKLKIIRQSIVQKYNSNEEYHLQLVKEVEANFPKDLVEEYWDHTTQDPHAWRDLLAWRSLPFDDTCNCKQEEKSGKFESRKLLLKRCDHKSERCLRTVHNRFANIIVLRRTLLGSDINDVVIRKHNEFPTINFGSVKSAKRSAFGGTGQVRSELPISGLAVHSLDLWSPYDSFDNHLRNGGQIVWTCVFNDDNEGTVVVRYKRKSTWRRFVDCLRRWMRWA